MKIFYLIIALNITACGFETVYRDDIKQDSKKDITNLTSDYLLKFNNKTSDEISFYQKELSAIKIKKNPDRLSQELKNNLYDLFSPDYVNIEAKYFLSFTIDKQILSTFTTISGASGRNKIILNISYQLRDINNLKEITSGKTIVSDNYNVTNNRFATYSADDEISLNLTKIAAINIRNNLINDLNDYHNKQIKKTNNVN